MTTDNTNSTLNEKDPRSLLTKDHVVPLLRLLATWGNTTTIIMHAGSVFEFKGVFPRGHIASGYYNLENGGKGFEGHLRIDTMAAVALQTKQHRGRESHAFVFQNNEGDTLFKVFLGRDADGVLFPEQVAAFERIRRDLACPPSAEGADQEGIER